MTTWLPFCLLLYILHSGTDKSVVNPYLRADLQVPYLYMTFSTVSKA